MTWRSEDPQTSSEAFAAFKVMQGALDAPHHPSLLPRLTEGFANVISGNAAAKLVIISDSTGNQYNAAGTYTGVEREQSWPSQMATRFTQRGLPTVTSSFFGARGISATLATVLAYDNRLTMDAAWSLGQAGPSGRLFENTTTTSALGFATGVTTDSADVYWLGESGGATFTIDIDGGAALATVNSNVGAGLYKTSVTYTRGTHTINIKRNGTGSRVQIWGIDAFDSTTPALRILNLSVAGATSATFGSLATGNPTNALSILSANAFLLCLGINDASAGNTAANFEANTRNIITRALATSGSADLLFDAPILGDTYVANPTAAALYPQYKAVYRALAAEYGRPFYDVNARLGDPVSGVYYAPGGAAFHTSYFTDGTHASKKGSGARALDRNRFFII